MNKKRTPLPNVDKCLLAILLALVLMLNNLNTIVASDRLPDAQVRDTLTSNTPEVYTVVEQMPVYPGGMDAMLKFIADNLKYPNRAQDDCLEGRVVIRFVVEKTGEVTNVIVLRGLDPEYDAEAVKVIMAMPNWIAGKQNGENVGVYFTVPILWSLKK